MPVDGQSLDLPAKPGVYLFKRNDDRVMYVGKATVLRDRVRSYFSKSPDRAMIPSLVEAADHVDCIVTQNPSEALMLERQLIRKHKPRYNSLLKDDKSYPFIAISNEEFPRILYTRHPPADASIWGPFPDAGAAKRVIQVLRYEFGIRDKDCKGKDGCMARHIGLCKGPCHDPEGYPDIVKAVIGVLDGDARVLIESLQREMDEASRRMAFENAARIRDMIATIHKTLSQQVIHSRFYQDCDAIGFSSHGDIGTVVILHTKDGTIQGQVQYPLIHRGDIMESIALVLSEHYASRRPPRTLLLPTPVSEWMEHWLTERRNGAIEIRVPQRGELAKLQAMADSNARIQAERNAKLRSGSLEQIAADDAANLLSMDSLDYIVCFDMAQLQGEERVGASVAMQYGRPLKEEYRTYKVKTDAPDDLRMMREVIERWIRKQENWPDLVLLDGGETHLNMMKDILDDLGLNDSITYAALAKKEETLYRPNEAPIILDRRGRLFIHARDEAHRFVNRFHRKRRARSAIADPLETVPGLGAKKLQSLLRHFGGRKGIEHATAKDLVSAPGIGPALAERIIEHLHR